MPTSVWLVSHAADAALRAGTFPDARGAGKDNADAVLDARAVEALAAWRKRWQARLPGSGGQAPRVVTSPAAIARTSAQAAGFEATPVEALADANCGAWRGKRLMDLAHEAPDATAALAAWTRDPGFKPPGGGESFDDVRLRVSAWLDALPESEQNAEQSAERSVIAFTHAVVIRAAILHALGAPSACFRSVEIAPLSVTALRRTRHGWVWLAAQE
jgi:broad specificity phosphatase PhoE